MNIFGQVKKYRWWQLAIMVLGGISLVFNGYNLAIYAIGKLSIVDIDQQKKISEIEQYVDSISPNYLAAVKALAQQTNSPSWGCGPSSYTLIQLINRKFFNDGLTVDANYDNNPYEIVERFGLAQAGNGRVIDHGWIEIYMKDKILFIDPTVAQFGHYNKIVYEVFSIGDPNITVTLYNKYGIIDYRLGLLVQKAIDRKPASADPYPGAIINPADIPYYQNVLTDRDQLNRGQEPADWKYWVTSLLSKFE